MPEASSHQGIDPPPRQRLVVGCMTGTSLDALDVALVRITGSGLDMSASLIDTGSRSFDALPELRETFRRMMAGEAMPAIAVLRARRAFGEMHADTVADLVERALPSGAALHAVVAHGQTVWHDGNAGLSWQLFDPWPLVAKLRVPVCFDLRQADLIAGGQGAPLTPISDYVMYRKPGVTRVVLNLGGVVNATYLLSRAGAEDVTGGDLGPCNILLDGLVERLFEGMRYDAGGAIAASGTVIEGNVIEGSPARRSLGREQFNAQWISGWMRSLGEGVKPADVLATGVDAVAMRIAGAVEEALASQLARSGQGEVEVVLAGGGARNAALFSRIEQRINQALAKHGPKVKVISSADVSIPPEAREAMGFAILGALAEDGVPLTLPAVTGCDPDRLPSRAGCWVYP